MGVRGSVRWLVGYEPRTNEVIVKWSCYKNAKKSRLGGGGGVGVVRLGG